MSHAVIISKHSNCKDCYKCIRYCPVKSIRFSSGRATVVPEECIACGTCYVICPKGAQAIRDDLSIAKDLVALDVPVIASIAPSFPAYFKDATFSSMKKALLELGFTDVEEAALGATIVKKEYERILTEEKPPLLISSSCHSVNQLIQKYYPDALPYLAPVKSPMQVHAMEIRRKRPDAKVIYFDSCIARKSEADSYPGGPDCVLTYHELTRWLNDQKVSLTTVEEAPDDRTLARAFATSGGILHTMTQKPDSYDYLTVEGIESCQEVLSDIVQGSITNCFIEMSACEGSCINGPVIKKRKNEPLRNYLSVRRYAGTSDFPVEMPEPKELKKPMAAEDLDRDMPSKKTISEILHKMGKTLPEHELNCGSCGYDTCRAKATAVFQGKAELSMCLPFIKEKAQSFSDNIINNTPNGILVINENLEVQQINKAARRILNIKYEGDILGDQVIRILDPAVFYEVIETGRNVHDQRVYLAEYRKYIEQTIIYDKGFHLIICIMRDVTTEERAREQKETMNQHTIDITDKVIEKQMRVVQEIASLLGETTAETKVALTKLKESLRGDD